MSGWGDRFDPPCTKTDPHPRHTWGTGTCPGIPEPEAKAATPEQFAVLEVVGPFHGEDFHTQHMASGRCHGIYSHREYALDVAREAAADAAPAVKIGVYRVELLEVVPRGEVTWGITCAKGEDGVCPAVDEQAARAVWRRWADPRCDQACGPHDLVRRVDDGPWRTVLDAETLEEASRG